MKIGILTTYDEINPGAYLQAYALQKFLEIKGFTTYIINYKTLPYFLAEYKIYLNAKNPISLAKNFLKILIFKKAHKKLRRTNFTFNIDKVNNKKFDIIILGSDEIWNFKSCIGSTIPAFYSCGLNARKIISYAPSFGTVDADNEFPEYVIDGIKKIKHISVRDMHSLKILKERFNIDAELVLDPTFLYEFDEEQVVPKYNRYILVYGMFDTKTQERIKNFSRKLNIDTISLFYKNRCCTKTVSVVSPFEWLGLMKNAYFIITNMYHGTIFSIKYKKKFALQVIPYRKNKLDTIINLFDLDKICLQSKEIEETYDTNLNYNKIFAKLDHLRNKSENFLMRSIND